MIWQLKTMVRKIKTMIRKVPLSIKCSLSTRPVPRLDDTSEVQAIPACSYSDIGKDPSFDGSALS